MLRANKQNHQQRFALPKLLHRPEKSQQIRQIRHARNLPLTGQNFGLQSAGISCGEAVSAAQNIAGILTGILRGFL